MKKPDRNILFIVISSALLFIPFLGRVHLFDWDEINFAEAAREMIVTHDYWRPQINFQPFWEKPPLFIWFQVLSMKLFGVTEFAARFPNAIIGIISLVVIYLIGKKLFSKQFGLIWVLVYTGSILPQLYFKSGIIDPTFNLFIFCGVYFLFERIQSLDSGEKKSNQWHSLLGGAFIGLAILTKGPVALLLSGLTVLICFIARLKSTKFYLKEYIIFVLSALGVALIWFGLETLEHGTWFIHEFIDYQVYLFSAPGAGHGGPWYYHPLVLLMGCFPASILFFYVFKKNETDSPIQRSFKLWMVILFFVVLIVFSIVKTKIVHYSSLCYFPLTFCAAYVLNRFRPTKNVLPVVLKILFLLVGVAFSALLIAVPVIGMNIKAIIPYVHDDFAKANMEANVSWSYAYTLIGIFYLMAVLITFYLIQQKTIFKGFISILICTIVMVQTVLVLVAPKIELYSQNAAITFYESLKNKDVYVDALGFNSYAQFFYTDKQEPQNKNALNQNWLLTGQVDKPVYFVCKINTADGYIQQYHLTKIGEKNGFVFLKRDTIVQDNSAQYDTSTSNIPAPYDIPPSPPVKKEFKEIYDFMRFMITDQKLNMSYGLEINPEQDYADTGDNILLGSLLISPNVKKENKDSFTVWPKPCFTKEDTSYMHKEKNKLKILSWDNKLFNFELSNSDNYYAFSIPLFSKNHQLALIKIDCISQGGLEGILQTLIYKNKGDKWILVGSANSTWIH